MLWNERRNKKPWNFCGIRYINMVDISRGTYEKNVVKTTIDNDSILRLYEKHIEKGLDYNILWEITIKYHSDHRKHWYELVEEPKKQVNRILIDKKLAMTIIKDCTTTSTQNKSRV